MKLIWKQTSEETLNVIIDYIENDFGILIAEKYYRNVLETIERIFLNPKIFPLYQKNNQVRKAVINKKTILYYKITTNKIV